MMWMIPGRGPATLRMAIMKMRTSSFSTYRKIAVSEKAKLDIELQFKQFDFNAALSFPFNIPKNYKRQ